MVGLPFARVAAGIALACALVGCGTESSSDQGDLRIEIPQLAADALARVEVNGVARRYDVRADRSLSLLGIEAGAAHLRVAIVRAGVVVEEGSADIAVMPDSVAEVSVETVPVTQDATAVEVTRLDEEPGL